MHAATGLNGRAQTDLPILAVGHPGTTNTLEGVDLPEVSKAIGDPLDRSPRVEIDLDRR